MPARDIHQDALDIARRYMREPSRGYEGGGYVSEIPLPPSPGEVQPQPTRQSTEPSWYDRATGYAGVINKGLAGIPGTVAALGNAAGAALTGNNPIDVYWRTQNAADEAFNAHTNPRDFKAAATEYPGASVMKGAATAAAHGMDNLADAAKQGIILTAPMAARVAKKYLHPDDMGGANRMREVTEHFTANPPKSLPEMKQQLDTYWREHGVAHYPDLNTGNLEPYTSVQAPGTGLLFREPGKGYGALEDFYNDPILYSLHPEARNINTSLDIDPKRWDGDQNGAFTRAHGGDPAEIMVEATRPSVASNILAHELTHANAVVPDFKLPSGANVFDSPAHLPSGATTAELNTINREIGKLLAVIDDPQTTYKGREIAQAGLDRLIERASHSKKMANYFDANTNPGEHLARMEQIFANARAKGIDPMRVPLIDFDDLDLTHMGRGWDLRRHRIVPLDEGSN